MIWSFCERSWSRLAVYLRRSASACWLLRCSRASSRSRLPILSLSSYARMGCVDRGVSDDSCTRRTHSPTRLGRAPCRAASTSNPLAHLPFSTVNRQCKKSSRKVVNTLPVGGSAFFRRKLKTQWTCPLGVVLNLQVPGH